MEADAYATALSVLGDEAGLRFADSIGLPAIIVRRSRGGDFVETMSAAARAMLKG